MGESRSSSTFEDSSIITTPPPPPPPPSSNKSTLLQPQPYKKKQKTKVVRVFRSVFRSLPIMKPCKFHAMPMGGLVSHHQHFKNITENKICGTLFGYRNGRVSFSLQEKPKCLPSLVLELSIQTNMLQKEMAEGMVRMALECEKRQEKDKTRLMDEPLWTMYCNGKKSGYGMRREATEEDLNVMEMLKAVSMGAGVLPGKSENVEGELAYMRAHFDHVVGSKDSETLYMLSPEGNCGPELTMFFVRI
ncbi:hypothetical protein TanjilG_31934 [Lupinus angustifolius]|uniref:Protein MIZU-KUSSEI 1-like n=1 Tax=Lupinus angustifolius TaxID=3871 RepID=A0A394D914_LUPAN|nr:PREDICTED: protein MIZU-KUSSEI 1-like [Lupinus angustifolius]OIW20016.1 hypothetical protein TanjilG_31934 [Lupinus angustifolius]